MTLGRLFQTGLLRFLAVIGLACFQTPLRAESEALPDDSVYQLDGLWKRQDGAELKLADLRGQPVVLTMGFTRCQGACPRLLADMRRLAAVLSPQDKRRVRFVFVTIDPAHDTPRVLASFLEKEGDGQSQWVGLTAKPDAVRELAVILGVNYSDVGGGQFAHSNRTVLLSPEGRIHVQHDGLGGDLSKLEQGLRNLLVQPVK